MRNQIITQDLEEISKSHLPFEKFTNKTVLIAGASGMIGGYLAESLLYLNEVKNLKINIVALARDSKKAQRRFSPYKNRKDLTLIIHDVIKPLKFDRDINFIIHAASQSSPKYFGLDPIGTLLPNVVGTKNLLELASLKNTEGFLFISSGEIYGHLDKNQIPVKETDVGRVDPVNIRSCYAEGKRLGETMCISWLAQYGLPVKIARPFHVYGPGMDLDDGRIFADFTKAIVEKKALVITSSGTARRSFCYLPDAVTAFFTIILLGGIGEAYNVGNSHEEVSIKKLAERLVRVFPEQKLKIVFKPDYLKKGYLPSQINRSYPNLTKIENLGWKPKHTIENGFKRTVNYYL